MVQHEYLPFEVNKTTNITEDWTLSLSLWEIQTRGDNYKVENLTIKIDQCEIPALQTFNLRKNQFPAPPKGEQFALNGTFGMEMRFSAKNSTHILAYRLLHFQIVQ